MKKLALGLFLALLLAFSPARAQVGSLTTVLCTKTATFTGSGSLASVIAGSTGSTISLCGWHITNTAASGTFAISHGTGTNCGTGTTSITPTLSITSSAPSADHTQYAWFSPPQGSSICVNATNATVTGLLYYSSN